SASSQENYNDKSKSLHHRRYHRRLVNIGMLLMIDACTPRLPRPPSYSKKY
ncbi:MAG: hypothetical protein ACI90V_001555, partial [Bacillariaceae sp.]